MTKKSSTAWYNRHIKDIYVKAAQKSGYRSRAAFKLLEIEKKFQILRNCNSALDMGAAPGGWLQILKMHNIKQIIGIDILPITPIAGITIIQGDFLSEEVKLKMQNMHFELVLSDMACNASGIKSIDHSNNALLIKEALLFSQNALKIGGHFIAKIMSGYENNDIIKMAKTFFKDVKLHKPKASRACSEEIYMIALSKNQ